MRFMDVRTSMVAFAGTSVVSALVAVLLWRQNRRRYPETLFWAIGLSLIGAGALLVSLRHFVSDFSSMVVGNSIALVGLMLCLVAVLKFLGRKDTIIPEITVIAAFFGIQYYYGMVEPDLQARNVALSTASLWISLRFVYVIFSAQGTFRGKEARGVALAFLAYALFFALRIALLGQYLESDDFLEAGTVQAAVILVYVVLSVVLVYALVLMYNKVLLDDVATSEATFARAFSLSPVAVMMTRSDNGTILAVNDRFSEIFGHKSEALVGKTTAEIGLYADDGLRSGIVATLASKGRVDVFEAEFRDAEGKIVVGMFSSHTIYIGGRLCNLSSIIDITDWRRSLEEKNLLKAKLAQSQRLESVGMLAGGVAHEINNPLNIVLNYAQIIHDEVSSEHVKDAAKSIIVETERMANIVKSLLSFAKTTYEEVTLEEPAALIRSTLAIMQAGLRKDGVSVEAQLPADLPLIRCRKRKIQQAIMNVVWNARDAAKASNQAGAAVRTVKVAASVVSAPETLLRVSVEDRGDGIAPDIASKVFDPFFSTKSRTDGTGLGLSIAYGIVTEHGGQIHFTSSDKGTTFFIDLPVINE